MLGALPVGLRFEEAVRITDAGLSSQRQLAGLWRRRQVIELDYARSLARLSVTGKAALQNINSSSRPSSPSTASTSTSPPTPLLQQLHSKDGGGSGPADGGVRQALEAAVDSMQAEAKSHENYSHELAFAASGLLVGVQDMESTRKKLAANYAASERDMHEAHVTLKKTQQLAAAAEREYAEAARALARTKHSAKLKESALAKSRARTEALSAKASTVAEQLAGLEMGCDRLR
eukprot:gene20444-5114_t